MAREIERKYRVPKAPRLPRKYGVEIRQGYLVAEGGELRIRKAGSRHTLTVKGEGGRARDEFETRIPRWVFEILWPHTTGRRIEKRRYAFEDGELDVYGGRHKGLVIFEREFSSVKKAKKYTLPGKLRDAVEVTEDPSYRNRSLATSAVPDWPEAP